jgi:hypothetical protein
VLVILKPIIDTVKVETDMSVYNEEDFFGMETDEVFAPLESEREVSHILK